MGLKVFGILVPQFKTMETEHSNRIQTSIFNATEKKILVWLASKQPKWVTSDLLTVIGILGAIIIATGYILSDKNINFLWISIAGLIINWYGDSLDGTLARVRGKQRPLYGYYLDHTIDGINESIMFIGAGLSSLMHLPLAMTILVLYLLMTINVSINAHLKQEFRLTYAKLGPTEFRIIIAVVNLLFIFIRPLREYNKEISLFGQDITLFALDIVAIIIIAILFVIYLSTIISDAKAYAKADPKK